MRYHLLIGCLLLAACAQQSINMADISIARNHQMAADTVHQLTQLYPAASTHIYLAQSANDAYGQALEKKLRDTGYAVQEIDDVGDYLASHDLLPDTDVPSSAPMTKNVKLSAAAKTAIAAPVMPVTVGAPMEAKNVALRYIVDHLEGNLYRVTLTLDSRILSRVYILSKNRFGAAGAWVSKE